MNNVEEMMADVNSRRTGTNNSPQSTNNTRQNSNISHSVDKVNRESILYSNTIMNLPLTNNSVIRVGPEYQAKIPCMKRSKTAKEYYGSDSEDESTLLWKPQPNINPDELQDFIDLAAVVANVNEDTALGLLTYQNYDLKKCIKMLNKIKIPRQQMDHADHAHFERFIFTEHKLDMIKGLFDSDMVNKLFLHYYTKQNRPPSFSEIFMINREEDTTIYDLIIQHLECTGLDAASVDLSTILEYCFENRHIPRFDITELEYFQRRRSHIDYVRQTAQLIRQQNLIQVSRLRKRSYDYLKWLHFLKYCKANPLWNIYEVLIFVTSLDLMSPRFCEKSMSHLLGTKSDKQCREFYIKHLKFIRNISKVKQHPKRIKMIKQYMGL